MSKKAAARAKRAAGVGKPAAKGAKPFYHDSSEDEDSDADSGVVDDAASSNIR